MRSLIQILPEVVVLVAIIGAILLIVLAFRNPFRPKWLRRDSMSVAAALLFSAAVCFGLGNMISGSVNAGIDVATAIALTVAVFIGAAYGLARTIDMGERLRRSDAGESPFYPHPWTEGLRRVWQRQFRGGADA